VSAPKKQPAKKTTAKKTAAKKAQPAKKQAGMQPRVGRSHQGS
jgi:hypothetical protein